MNYITFSNLNNISEISFVAGTTYTLEFVIYDEDNNPVDISAADCTWNLAPFGTDYAILTKTANVITTNSFEIILSSVDTKNLSDGKYTHQLTIVFESGVEVVPAQGILVITKRIR